MRGVCYNSLHYPLSLTHTLTCTRTCTHVCTCAHTHTHAHAHARMYAHVHTHTYTHAHTHTHTHTRLDCYMSLSVPYAIKVCLKILIYYYTIFINHINFQQLAKALEPYKLKWIEEALHPDDYQGYSQLRNSLLGTVLVTTGEHEYTRL